MLLLPPPPLPHAASAAPSSAAPALLLPIRCVSRLLPPGSTPGSRSVKSRSGLAAAAVDNAQVRARCAVLAERELAPRALSLGTGPRARAGEYPRPATPRPTTATSGAAAGRAASGAGMCLAACSCHVATLLPRAYGVLRSRRTATPRFGTPRRAGAAAAPAADGEPR